MLILFDQLSVDEISFNDMLNNFYHEAGVTLMSFMEDAGNANKFIPMHLNSNVCSVVSCIVALFIDSAVCALINLLLCNMAFYFSDSDTVGAFRSGRSLKMVPEVTI